jgi:hypothetical protein
MKAKPTILETQIVAQTSLSESARIQKRQAEEALKGFKEGRFRVKLNTGIYAFKTEKRRERFIEEQRWHNSRKHEMLQKKFICETFEI